VRREEDGGNVKSAQKYCFFHETRDSFWGGGKGECFPRKGEGVHVMPGFEA